MYGVIDIGSNTIRLSLYEVKDSVIRPMLNKKRVVGLASYIDDNGILTHKGIEKAIDTLNEYKYGDVVYRENVVYNPAVTKASNTNTANKIFLFPILSITS